MRLSLPGIASGIEPTSSAVGLVGLLISLFGKKDRILVVSEHYQPMETQTEGLYIVNLSNHEVHIKDYGFMLGNGKYFSIPACNTFSYGAPEPNLEYYRQPYFDGSRSLKSREIMQCGKMMHGMDVIGSYAITATQSEKTRNFKVSWINPRYYLARYKLFFFPAYDHRFD